MRKGRRSDGHEDRREGLHAAPASSPRSEIDINVCWNGMSNGFVRSNGLNIR